MGLKAFFDGSGQEDSKFLTLSGVAAEGSVWREIDERWNAILRDRDPKAEYLHMRELIGLRGHFGRWKGWTEEKRGKLITDLLLYAQTIDKQKFRLFSCTVDTNAHVKLKAEGYELEAPLQMCITYCVGTVLHWYLFMYQGLDLKADYYFDQGERFKQEFEGRWIAELDRAKGREGYTLWQAIHSVQVEDAKKVPGLQFADWFGWSANRRHAKVAETFQHLNHVMLNVMPSLTVVWDEAKLRAHHKKPRPLIYTPYDQR